MIQNLLCKEFLSINERINILYAGEENNIEFYTFVQNLFTNTHFIKFEDTLYGINSPNIVISNTIDNETLVKCVEICKYFHIPLLLVFNNANDYEMPDIDIFFEPYKTISLSPTTNKILLKKYNTIMKFDIYDKKNINKWRSYILDICKQPFIITNENNEYFNK